MKKKIEQVTTMKELRQRTGLTTTQIAAKLGRTEGMIRFWESGQREPTLPLRDILLVLDAYQCTPEELVEAIENTRPRGDKK